MYADTHSGNTRNRGATCPKCQSTFDISYARIFACSDCPESALSCGMIKCPRCGHEFPK